MAKTGKAATSKTAMIRRPASSDPRYDRVKNLAGARRLTLWAYIDKLVSLHEGLLDDARRGSRTARAVLDAVDLREVDA